MSEEHSKQLKRVGKDRLPELQKYIELKILKAQRDMEAGTVETFGETKGRLLELRRVVSEIDYLLREKK